jgi:hypothetical protein
MHPKTKQAARRLSSWLIVATIAALIILNCASIIKDIAAGDKPAANYDQAVKMSAYVCFETEGSNNSPLWSTCTLTTYPTTNSGPYKLPDEKHYWLPSGAKNAHVCHRTCQMESGLVHKTSFEGLPLTPIDHMVMNTIPYGACRWRCDPEEDPEQCLTQ